MKIKNLFNISVVLFVGLYLILHVSCAYSVIPYLAMRSIGENAARDIVGIESLMWRAPIDQFNGVFLVNPGYTRILQPTHVCQALFGPALIHGGDQSDLIKIQGSQVPNRDSQALLADYFYLPTDFSSVVTFSPCIETFSLNFDFYFGFDEALPGLFLWLHGPLAFTHYGLGFCEGSMYRGVHNAAPGYLNDSYTQVPAKKKTGQRAVGADSNQPYGIARPDLVKNFEEFIFERETISGVTTTVYEPLRYARMSPYRLTRAKLAEIQYALGWNFMYEPDYHLGLSLRGSLPTGNIPEAEFLFEPIIGNGHHAELGAGLWGHYDLWKDAECQRNFSVYVNANVTHLFGAHQKRTFDLTGKPLSRYMLVMDVEQPVNNLLLEIPDESFVRPGEQFQRLMTPLANISTLNINVSVPVQCDIALDCAYKSNNWQWDIGYNFWYRSCEHISVEKCSNNMNKCWALKGDEFVFGFADTGSGANPEQPGIALSATQSKATIFSGRNGTQQNHGLTPNQNSGIDQPSAFAADSAHEPLMTYDTDTSSWQAVLTTQNPQLFGIKDLDIACSCNKGVSHKFFTNIQYLCSGHKNWTPFLGLGAEVEFGLCDIHDQFNKMMCADKNYSCTNTCKECSHFALSQWTLWIKGGLSFPGAVC